ncbi:hypothetical protein M422DRAFT_180080 [Sphaerobolus stellatus SS14]|uniref:Uncharacterized protein n=1 Tax=Sphaerobolus stellatus (strain SS14) TaxID=990650 RepID=A0A0C9V2H0_SPHS4|nr:hypothetical protein M422DRAFT_180080 [Sphaerobolus stellatus SS14]
MNTVNISTGFSPFQLKTGRSPRLIPPIIPILTGTTEDDITAHEIIIRLQMDVQEAQDNLLAAKVRQAYHANEHCAPEDIYQPSDFVMLSMTHWR